MAAELTQSECLGGEVDRPLRDVVLHVDGTADGEEMAQEAQGSRTRGVVHDGVAVLTYRIVHLKGVEQSVFYRDR